eukprot:scaffold131466_cov19-Tisochrysis_lutea.AAC.1
MAYGGALPAASCIGKCVGGWEGRKGPSLCWQNNFSMNPCTLAFGIVKGVEGKGGTVRPIVVQAKASKTAGCWVSPECMLVGPTKATAFAFTVSLLPPTA